MEPIGADPAWPVSALRGRPGPILTAELVPPRSSNVEGFRTSARALAAFADAVNVPDGPRATVRLCALAAAAIARSEGVQPIVQMTVRDRNRLALCADALGAVALGVRAFLPLWGDPITHGDLPEAAEVRDLDTLGLIALLDGLRHGQLPGSRSLEGPAPRFEIGAAATATTGSLDGLRAKIDAGATFVQTQIVLDVALFAQWLARVRESGLCERVAVLAGVAVPTTPARLRQFGTFGAPASDRITTLVQRGEAMAAIMELLEHLAGLEGLAGVHLMPLDLPVAEIAQLASHVRAIWPAR